MLFLLGWLAGCFSNPPLLSLMALESATEIGYIVAPWRYQLPRNAKKDLQQASDWVYPVISVSTEQSTKFSVMLHLLSKRCIDDLKPHRKHHIWIEPSIQQIGWPLWEMKDTRDMKDIA